jgi:TatD DNase family protein
MLIDAHAHLDRYETELDQALEEISRHNILTIACSMSLRSYARNLRIAERSRLVIPIFGVHPWNASGYISNLKRLDRPIAETPMLGEIGLDFHFVRDASRYPAQRVVFEYQLVAAREQSKIVNLHTKGAESEVLELLDRFHIERAIVHWYSGPRHVLAELIARRMYFTIGVEVIYSEEIKAIARQIPSDLLLTETDNPGGLKWLADATGMPSVLTDVVSTLAELRGTTAEALADSVRVNFARLTAGDRWFAPILAGLPRPLSD